MNGGDVIRDATWCAIDLGLGDPAEKRPYTAQRFEIRGCVCSCQLTSRRSPPFTPPLTAIYHPPFIMTDLDEVVENP